MRRVSIVGSSGSGKTTLGRALADRLGVPRVELDGIFHQPGWADLPVDEFRKRVREQAAKDGWVIDGNYSDVQDLVWQRADTVVWLDLPRTTAFRRVTIRTLRRAITREQLWNGNREPLTNFYRWDPKKNVMRWSWVKHGDHVARYEAAMGAAEYRRIRFIRLKSPNEVAKFIAGIRIGS